MQCVEILTCCVRSQAAAEQLVGYAKNEEEKAACIAKHKALLQKMLDLDDEIQDDLAEAGSPVPATPILNEISASVVDGSETNK